jgi:D-serine deaminase-like pyridoxal phosphate-dependent protein
MDDSYILRNGAEIASPALLFFLDGIRANLDRATELAGDPERLRPHVKTHKCPNLVREQMRRGINKFKCAVLQEARMLAECGAPDVLLAYPLMKREALEFAELSLRYPETRFSALIDHPLPARWLSEAAASLERAIDVYVDLDVGMGRTGTSGEAFRRLYAEAARLEALRVVGIHAYDGHVHERDPEKRRRLAEGIYREVMEMKRDLERAGREVPRVVLGGTPAFPLYAKQPEVELSPGTFVLYDEGYRTAFPDLPFEPAALILARVVSIPALGTVTLNAGSKGISTDSPGISGKVLGIPVVKSGRINEEHWVLEMRAGSDIEIGQEVLIIPTHICTTVNLYAYAHVVDSTGRYFDRWEIAARGHAPAGFP